MVAIIEDARSFRNSSQARYDISGAHDVGVLWMPASGQGPWNDRLAYYCLK